MISNPNKAVTPYCSFYGQSITGMCPHCDVHQKDHPKCSHICKECKIPLHPECMWEWHRCHKGFDQQDWYRRNVTGTANQAPLQSTQPAQQIYPVMYGHVLPGTAAHTSHCVHVTYHNMEVGALKNKRGEKKNTHTHTCICTCGTCAVNVLHLWFTIQFVNLFVVCSSAK